MSRDRDESGRYSRQITDEKVLQVFDKFEDERSQTVLSATNVAEHLGCTRQAADQRLRDLEEEGKVRKHQLGKRNVAWERVNRRKRHDRSSSGE